MSSKQKRIGELLRKDPDDQVGVRGEQWAGLYLYGNELAQIVVEELDGSFDLFTYADFEEVRQVWASIEKTIEGEPAENDIVLEERHGVGWKGFHWTDPDNAVLTGYHSLEDIVPAAFRWLAAHNLEITGNVWVKEGGEFSLLELT